MENNTAKHFVLQLGSVASLYLSLIFLLVLLFSIINIQFPDAVDSVWQMERAEGSARLAIAMVLVFFPTYLVLTRLVNNTRRKEKTGKYLGLTKWLIYLSLLAGGAVLLGDLVAVIMTFLEGEITQRFILKALSVVVIIGAAFTYYILDAKGYWLVNEKKSLIFAGVATSLVVISIIFGFMNINNPSEVREIKLDNQMVSDLQEMQWRIEEYYRTNSELPTDLPLLYGEFPVPAAPENREAYVYEVTSETEYRLCATFLNDMTRATEYAYRYPTADRNYNWNYQAGEYCFERNIPNEILK